MKSCGPLWLFFNSSNRQSLKRVTELFECVDFQMMAREKCYRPCIIPSPMLLSCIYKKVVVLHRRFTKNKYVYDFELINALSDHFEINFFQQANVLLGGSVSFCSSTYLCAAAQVCLDDLSRESCWLLGYFFSS